MKVLLIAAIAVAVSGAAFAKDIKRNVMTDPEMEKVTAAGTFTGCCRIALGSGLINFNSKPNNHAVDNGFQGDGLKAAHPICVRQGCQ